MGVKFEELSSYYKLLFMFGYYGYNISAEMGKELDCLTKLYSKLKSSDKYNCLPIETRQFLYIDRLLLDITFPNSLCLTD
jgi:hypothetical protein